MAQQIKLKRSAIAGKVPTTSSLDTGELAINTADGKLYFVRDDGTIQTIVTTNAVVTGSVNINGPITGSDIRINQWGSVSASLSTISSQAATVPTLDQVTDQGSSTTNFIEVGSISTSTTGGFIAGVFKTTDGLNTVILESAGTGGTNPGSTILQFRDSKGTQTNGAITYGGNAGDYLRLNTSAGTVFGITGSGVNSTYVFTGNNSGTGSFSWDLNTTFIQKVGGGTTQFLGNATTATTAISASLAATASIATSATSATRASTVSVSGINTDASYTFPLIVTGSSGPSIGLNIDTVNVGIIYNPSTNLFRATNLSATGSIFGTASYASDADLLDGQHGSYYLDASNINAGTIADAYLPGTISSDITGNAATATTASYAATASSADSFIIRTALTASGLSYPTTDGLFTGQVLQTNAAGTLAFGNVSAVFETIRNGEITTVVRGTPLYVSGAQGDQPICYRANTSDPTKMPVTFVAMEDIAAGQGGRGITLGLITGIDMTGYSAGTQLWVDGLGVLTDVRPTGSTDIVQPIGIVTKTGNGGQLNVLNPGPVLLPNIVSGSTWVGSATNYPVAVPTSSFRVAFATSASYALTASAVNQLNQNVTINGNLTVFGSSSFTYVTSSQLNVDDSFISVNVFEPVERFGGLKVYDSGSSNATASLAWDSLHNHWVYQNSSGSTYTGGMFLSGPRNTGSLGDEPNLAKWYVPRSDGGDHLDNSQIYSSGSVTIITGSLTTSGKVNIETVDNYGSDPDKFLAIVSNEVVYRTGAQLLSDIGGQTAGTFVQNAGGGGQARYILRYEDSNSATTSSIYESTAGNIGIKTLTPLHPLHVSGTLAIQGSGTVVQQGILVSGTTSITVASISTGSYEGAFLDYVIASGSNKRAGTLTTVWTPSAIEWNDASTLDLGSTIGAEFTPALIGPNADLVLAVPAGTWTVKGHLRYI